MRLSKEEIALLRRLDSDSTAGAAAGAEAPKRMFELNLLTRLGAGGLQLTQTGARALFQAECIDALEQAVDGLAPEMPGGVERWLVSSGFMQAASRTISARGKLWLASLTPDGTQAGSENADNAAGTAGAAGPCAAGALSPSVDQCQASALNDSGSAEQFAARRG